MRPTPEEVIVAVRALLKSDIAPHQPAPAQLQLKRVMAVLRDGRWNEAAFDLMHENTVFAGLARSSAARLEMEGNGSLEQLARELAASADIEQPRSFAEANEINRDLRDALARLIEKIRDEKLMALDGLCQMIGAALLGLRKSK